MSKFTAVTAGADGDLDLEFNGTGKMTLAFGKWAYYYSHAAEGPDGKLYFVGALNSDRLGIACLHKNGTLNVAFGTDGFVFQDFGKYANLIMPKIHFIEDGAETKILICAENFYTENYLARFHMDGRLDTAFGVNGLRTIVLPSEFSGSPEHTPTPLVNNWGVIKGTSKIVNGKIYLSGRLATRMDIPDYAILTRLNADYSLDTSFNGTGFVNVFKDMEGVSLIRINDMLVQNGKITVCGWLDTDLPDNSSLRYCMLARLNENGTIDKTFADDGFLLFQNSDMSFHTITQYNEDSILIAGRHARAGLLACFDKEGQLDARFNGGEMLYHHFPGGNLGEFHNVAVDQGKIIVSGSIYLTYNTGLLMVARYLMNGNPDLSFGKGNGWATADFSDYSAYFTNMVIQNDGKVVVAGESFGEYTYMPIARFLNATPSVAATA